MFSLVMKALLLIWPFLKRAIFKDRTVTEVMLENKHVTVMFIMILLLLGSLVMVTSELNAVRSAHRLTKAELISGEKCLPPEETLSTRRALLGELLK
jgi:hypothetical protein